MPGRRMMSPADGAQAAPRPAVPADRLAADAGAAAQAQRFPGHRQLQASSVVIVSPTPEGVSVLPRAFEKPMSVASAYSRLAVATRNELVVFAASRALAPGYPQEPGKYARLWLPRTLRFTGEVDLHDLAFTGQLVLGVATRLSCIVRLDDHASVTPLWRPPFVSGPDAG
jgi:uncharacterized protein (TIGR03032 family)